MLFTLLQNICFSADDSQNVDVSPELLADLKVEAKELIEKYGMNYANLMLALENGVELGREDVDDLFRNLHSLKGLARMAGVTAAESLLHKLEDYVDAVRNGQKQFEKSDLDPLSELETVFTAIFDEAPGLTDQTQSDAQRLANYFGQKSSGAPLSANTPPPSSSSTGANSPTASSVEESFSDTAPPSTVTEGLTSAEMALYEKFKARAENFFVVVTRAGEFADVASLNASETADGIGRIGEIIFSRCNATNGGIIVFAAELEISMLSALFGENTFELSKTSDALSKINTPWSFLRFDASQQSEKLNIDMAMDLPLSNAFPNAPDISLSDLPELGAQQSQVVQQSQPPITASNAAPSSAPEDDFDTNNLAMPTAAADLDPELLQDFLTNADELLDQLNQSMLSLESNPSSKDAIESIFRSAHTIKGTSGMFGFRAIEKLTHVMENLFDRIRKNELQVTPLLVDGLLFGLDRVRAMFENIKGGKSSELPINDAIAKLKVDASGNVSSASSSSTPVQQQPTTNHQATVATPTTAPSQVVAAPAKQPASGGDVKESKPAENKPASEANGTIRVDLKRLDALVNLVGELVIDRTRFARIEEELRNKNDNSDLSHQMSESVLLFGRHMNEVQNIIMKVRMVPVGSVFNKFSRVVRDLARQCNKEIELIIEGGETELDKTLVEEIGDPLVHLIRNSCDHGIEMPDERVAAKKNRRGSIRLSAYQDGNMIVISVQDDGKGLNVDKIKAKALQQGLIKETDHLTDKEVYNLIFEPGFSTAEKVTNISGRGVGMDVVKKNILKLKGIIEIDSKLGEGITTIIKLPLTLAIIPSLMVESFGESYAIPLVNVVESIRISPEDIQHIGNADFVKLRDRVLPLLKMSDVFELNHMQEKLWYRVPEGTHILSRKERKSEDEAQALSTPVLPVLSSERRKRMRKPRLIFVVVNAGEKRVGVIVDQLLGQQEIVVKSLGRLLKKQRGVAGGCVLGNGRVALVVDVGELVEDFSQNNKTGGSRVAS